jgi:outer membrane biosynthesis protein TonB
MSSHRSGARTRLARRVSWLAALSLTTVALLAPATVAAHTPKVSLTCEYGLKVNLTQYNTNGTNSVAISIDGVPAAGSPFTFGASYVKTFAVEPPTAAHTALVVVSAWDDPNGNRGWSKTFQLSIDACVEPTPEPTPTPTPEPTPTPTPEPTPTPTPTPTPEVEEEPSPETEDTEPTPTPTPETDVEPSTNPEPTGEVEGSTGTPTTPRATLPPTDTVEGASETAGGDAWRLVLLAMAGAIAAMLTLTPARAVVRKDDNAR